MDWLAELKHTIQWWADWFPAMPCLVPTEGESYSSPPATGRAADGAQGPQHGHCTVGPLSSAIILT